MSDVLNLTWNYGSGRMSIVVKEFFPASQTRIRKLNSVVQMDWSQNDFWEKVVQILQEAIEETRAEMKVKANEHTRYRTEEIETKNMIQSKKMPNGVPLTRDQIKEFRDKRMKYGEIARAAKRDFNHLKKKTEKLKDNIKFIRGEYCNDQN